MRVTNRLSGTWVGFRGRPVIFGCCPSSRNDNFGSGWWFVGGRWFPRYSNDTEWINHIPQTLFTMLHFTLSTKLNSLMNISILIATTAPMPWMIVTISIAMFVKTITHSNHSLKLKIMVAISWPLAACVCVFACRYDINAAGDYRLPWRFRKCCSAKKWEITLFSSLGVTSVTTSYTYVFPSIEFTYNLEGLMQGGRSSIANTSKLSHVCINPLICSLLSSYTNLSWISTLLCMHALRVASMTAVRSDLTCLYFIMSVSGV